MVANAAATPQTPAGTTPPAAAAAAPTVTEDALDVTLKNLLKAAEDATLNKGPNAISNSGTYGSDGPQGGGQAGYGDAGGLDRMMIAKMIDKGMMQPTPEFMHGFQEENEEGDEDSEMGGYWRGMMHGYAKQEPNVGDGRGEEFMHGYMRGHKKGADMAGGMGGYADGGFIQNPRPTPTGKSGDAAPDADPLSKALTGDPVIQQAIDASEFMENLTKHVAEALDSIQKSTNLHEARQSNLNVALAKALHQMGGLLKSRDAVIEELGNRLGIVEKQPMPPKGATTLKGAAALAKSVTGAADGAGGTLLSKSETVATLSFMNLEKGMHEINGRKTVDLVTLAEAGNIIDAPTKEAIDRFLATHPNEADRARTYA